MRAPTKEVPKFLTKLKVVVGGRAKTHLMYESDPLAFGMPISAGIRYGVLTT